MNADPGSGDNPLRGRTGRVPAAATALGLAGLVPFVAGAAGLWLFESTPRLEATLILFIGYGAVILSFMGAIHFGLALGGAGRSATRAMCVSGVPPLLAWVALALPAPAGVMLLSVGFVGIYLVDTRAIAIGLAPAWYQRLRLPLTVAVLACLLTGLAAIVQRGLADRGFG